MKRTILLIIVLLSIIIIMGCTKTTPKTPITGDLTVELKIRDQIPKSLTILNDGKVIFNEGSETNEIQVSQEEIESLKQYIIDNDFFSLKEKYEGDILDGVATTITVTIGEKTYSVYCYMDCPQEFRNINQKILSLWPYEIKITGFA